MSVTPDPVAPGTAERLEPSAAGGRGADDAAPAPTEGPWVAETARAARTLETSHPASDHLLREDVAPGVLRRTPKRALCAWKGQPVYFHVLARGDVLPHVAWSHRAPTSAFASLRDHVAFYAAPFDEGFVDGERATSELGRIRGGWITSQNAEPLEGVPGSRFW